ncbi:MAG: membrane protein insertion efficiency factor YidD [bacterium]|nr:membrane protein insertion efficiency factor YidD [bacterium]
MEQNQQTERETCGASITRIPRLLLVVAIELYQRTLSPDHGPLFARMFPHGFCRYYPSCSAYGKSAIMQNGVLIGSMKATWRILRCNPWSKGGVDNT